jgi:RNA polymerase sigma factor (sigma-70 family)
VLLLRELPITILEPGSHKDKYMVDADFERELVEALPLMERTASVYVRRGDDRRDVVQEAALRAWANRGQFRGDSKFSSWAHTIVRNVVLEMHRRKHAGTRPPEVSMPNFFDVVDDTPMTAHEDWPVIEELLPTLPKHMQVAIDIRLKDLNAGPTSTNKVRYYRAILVLRAKLRRRGNLRADR